MKEVLDELYKEKDGYKETYIYLQKRIDNLEIENEELLNEIDML